MFIINILGNITDQFCKIMWIILQIYNYGYRQWVTYSGVREGGGGGLFKGDNYFKCFCQRRAIIILVTKHNGKTFFQIKNGKSSSTKGSLFLQNRF